MSWHLQNQVDESARAGVYKSIYETTVMRALASFANDDGGSCFPALNNLAKRSQCSQSTVWRVLQQFKKRKWIAIKHTGRSNRYQILPHGCAEPKAVNAAFGRRVTTDNAEKPSNFRERMVSETIQNSQPDQSEYSLRPIRIVSETNDSFHSPSSKNAHHINSLSSEREKENECPPTEDSEEVTEEEVTNEEEPQSFVTISEDTTRRLRRVPPPARGATSEANATAQRCVCDSTHPPGMPSLEEIRAEMRKLRPPDWGSHEDWQKELWLNQEAEELHDVWLSNGFRTKSGPIKNWKASLRNWLRWQRDH